MKNLLFVSCACSFDSVSSVSHLRRSTLTLQPTHAYGFANARLQHGLTSRRALRRLDRSGRNIFVYQESFATMWIDANCLSSAWHRLDCSDRNTFPCQERDCHSMDRENSLVARNGALDCPDSSKISAKYQNTFRSPAVLLYREGTKWRGRRFWEIWY